MEGTSPNGTLTAKVEGSSETNKSPISVEEGKWVIFTATPDEGYRVKEWKLDGNVIKNKSNTYAHEVTKAAAITVSFEPSSVKLTLNYDKNTVKVKAKTKDGSAMKVEGCRETELKSDVETTLTAIGTKVTLIGDIIELNCSGEAAVGGNGPLIALDVSGCTALQKLNCRYNYIAELNVQGLNELQELYCNGNKITEFDVHGLTKLEKLDCNTNRLTAFNVSGCIAMKELICNGNPQLSTLDASGLTELQELNCQSNKLTSLNVQGCTALQKLNCRLNQLKSLDVQDFTKLQELSCDDNKITALDVHGLTELQKLYCDGNQLTTLNVQGCTALKRLLCYQNKLNADAFTKLFNDLPKWEKSDGAAAILYVTPSVHTPQANDGNCTNFSTPESLKKAFEGAKNVKHWKMQKVSEVGFPSDI